MRNVYRRGLRLGEDDLVPLAGRVLVADGGRLPGVVEPAALRQHQGKLPPDADLIDKR